MDRELPLSEALARIQRRLEQARLDLISLQAAVLSAGALGAVGQPSLRNDGRLPAPARAAPAIPVADSISPDGRFIYCLIDGKKLQMLRKYLRRYGHTPASYRAAFGLPPDYPMTAPGYSARKREEAYRVGLGTGPNRAGSGSGARPNVAGPGA
ncbi:MAG: MucR family transcriptional regulator [Acetobacteraceae bacterium]|nr:MucR family transcriptional regulator [Acetobacteraceae bacterium]